MLEYQQIGPGSYDCTLDLSVLPGEYAKNISRVEENWEEFINEDKWMGMVLEKKENIIKYKHKSWIPEYDGSKKKMLLLAGNPAPQSVHEDVYYAYESSGAEHRFWKVMRELGYIDLEFDLPTMKDRFFKGDYISDYHLGIEVGHTFPTPASGKWSGVQGIKRLLGSAIFKILQGEERKRLDSFMKDFLVPGDIVIAMQKNAYEMASEGEYAVKEALAGNLRVDNGNMIIWGTPPTRWMYTKKFKRVFSKIKDEFDAA